ncbi:gag/pol protein [Gossypium australe]|uniref:Gag/pol protein n=1 Tax=Gossypium australe TaxID=47621 RepID=A0A5B6WQ40_9ROSI|nr:gag/pol protein [Gossypium australe]
MASNLRVKKHANDQQHRDLRHSKRVSHRPKFFKFGRSVLNIKSAEQEDDDALKYDEAIQMLIPKYGK